MSVARERVTGRKWRIVALTAVVFVACALAGTSYAAGKIRGKYNRVQNAAPYRVSEPARKLHESLTIVDHHADSLLWTKDLLERSSTGHVDVPRLRDGNVAIQAFTIVTKVPKNQNIESTADVDDQLGYLTVVEHWPPNTWKSPLNRALYQASNLRKAEANSDGSFIVLRTSSDLNRLLAARTAQNRIVGGYLGLEGAHGLEGLSNLAGLYDAGFRIIGLTHFFDNEFAGSSSGVKKYGLTPLGEQLLRRAEEKDLILDLAHASHKTIMDVTRQAKRPVLVSHTGVKGVCNNNRNLSDEELRAVAQTGGLVGLGYWRTATCGTDAKAIAKSIRYAANVIGIEHVGLGSDFDGAVTQPFDVTGVPLITEALQGEGFSEAEIRLVMGGNAVRFLKANLPAE
jgi:membrane dipeptidase